MPDPLSVLPPRCVRRPRHVGLQRIAHGGHAALQLQVALDVRRGEVLLLPLIELRPHLNLLHLPSQKPSTRLRNAGASLATLQVMLER